MPSIYKRLLARLDTLLGIHKASVEVKRSEGARKGAATRKAKKTSESTVKKEGGS